MPHDREYKARLVTYLLWFGLVIACLGLFAALSDGGVLRGKLGGPRTAPSIVNATSFDGSPDIIDLQKSGPQRDMRELRNRVRVLETEIATLKRQNRTPQH
ncbi:hypothetical protein [Methylomagnum sp.]